MHPLMVKDLYIFIYLQQHMLVYIFLYWMCEKMITILLDVEFDSGKDFTLLKHFLFNMITVYVAWIRVRVSY